MNVEVGVASGEVVEVNDVAAGAVVNYSKDLVGAVNELEVVVENKWEAGENLAVAVVGNGRNKLEAGAIIPVVVAREGEAVMEKVVGVRVEGETVVVVKVEVVAENKQVVVAVGEEGVVEVSKLVEVEEGSKLEVVEAKEMAVAVMVVVGKRAPVAEARTPVEVSKPVSGVERGTPVVRVVGE